LNPHHTIAKANTEPLALCGDELRRYASYSGLTFVQISEKAKEMLRYDLDNENET